MTTSTPAPSPRFRVVRGARFLLDLRPINEVPFHVAVESAFKEGQIVALVSVDDPRLQAVDTPRQTTPPTVEQVLRNKFWWFIPRISSSDLRLVMLDCNCSPGLVSEGPYDIALYDGEWIPCLPPGVEDAEIKRLRAVEAYAIHVGRCLRGCFFRDGKLNPAPDCKTGSDFAAIGAA